MSIIVSNCQHCDKQQFRTHVYTTNFLSSKVMQFIHTSAVTRSRSCYGKNYAYASRTSCYYFSLVVYLYLVTMIDERQLTYHKKISSTTYVCCILQYILLESDTVYSC